MNIKPRRFNTNLKQKQEVIAIPKITNITNDVSFSIPEWRQKQIKSINQQYQKQIYSAVQLSLTDFQSKQEVQFLSKPQKSSDQRYAYERNLIHASDFSILAFILCFEQLLIGESLSQAQGLQKFKKKINQLDLCSLTQVPIKMSNYYDNKVLKKILFQYINKGSYNVSLLQVLLRRNSVLKFSLSLVSKAILKKRGLMSSYTEKIPFHIQMRNCGDEFGVLSTIKVKDKHIQTENFYIAIQQNVKILRKQNIIQTKRTQLEKSKIQRSSTPPSSNSRGSKIISRKSTKESRSTKQQQSQQNGKYGSKQKKILKRSNSVADFFKKFICF